MKNYLCNLTYYQTHDFHKLAKKLGKRNCFSALHTNICSLNANLVNLELLLTNLDHAFEIKSVSETWTSENNNNNNKTIINHTISGYQKICGTKGLSPKSGWELFVKEDARFKERNDLRVKFIKDQNEFHSCCIEIINDKNTKHSNWAPLQTTQKNSDGEFLKNLKDTLNKVKNRNKHIAIYGDFNCHCWNMSSMLT